MTLFSADCRKENSGLCMLKRFPLRLSQHLQDFCFRCQMPQWLPLYLAHARPLISIQLWQPQTWSSLRTAPSLHSPPCPLVWINFRKSPTPSPQLTQGPHWHEALPAVNTKPRENEKSAKKIKSLRHCCVPSIQVITDMIWRPTVVSFVCKWQKTKQNQI